MVREYVGARYVPRFTGLYDATQIYDALDVVDNGSGTSYIAKKTVPAGTALTNTDYWFVYGATSGAILDLQNRMSEAEDDIDDLETATAVLGNDDIYARLHGKTIIALGDSLTEGSGSAAGKTWVEKIATRYGAICYNEGHSGYSIAGPEANSLWYIIDSVLAAHDTCDIFVISGGANDKNKNCPPGSAKSAAGNTTSGALKVIIDKVRQKYGKDCRILAMTTYHRYNDYNTGGYCEYDYVQAVLSSAAYYGIPCFNNYDSSGMILTDDIGTSNAWMDVGYVDGGVRNYHFSEYAYDYMTPIYAAFLATGLANNTAVAPNYLNDSANTTFYYRQNNQDGFGASVMHKWNQAFTFIDFGNHVALLGQINFTIPKEYAIKYITKMEATVVIDSWTILTAITDYEIQADGSIIVRVGGIGIYGSTPPVSETGEVFIRLEGILLQ